MEIQSRSFFFFFLLNFVEPKHQSDEYKQPGAWDFKPLVWIFSVFWQSPA